MSRLTLNASVYTFPIPDYKIKIIDDFISILINFSSFNSFKMKRLTQKHIILFYFLNTTLANPNQPYGSTCSLEDGAAGFCADISNCPTLRNLLRDHLITVDRIKICNKSLRYMCCPNSIVEEITTKASVTSTIAQKKQTITSANVLTTSQGQVNQDKLREIGK